MSILKSLESLDGRFPIYIKDLLVPISIFHINIRSWICITRVYICCESHQPSATRPAFWNGKYIQHFNVWCKISVTIHPRIQLTHCTVYKFPSLNSKIVHNWVRVKLDEKSSNGWWCINNFYCTYLLFPPLLSGRGKTEIWYKL